MINRVGLSSCILTIIFFVSAYAQAQVCPGYDYECAGHFQIQQGLQNRLQNAFPDVPLSCFNIFIRRAHGLCAQCADFDDYVEGTNLTCEDVVGRVNELVLGAEVPREIRCSYGVRITLKSSCRTSFNNIYGRFPRVRFERLGDWIALPTE